MAKIAFIFGLVILLAGLAVPGGPDSEEEARAIKLKAAQLKYELREMAGIHEALVMIADTADPEDDYNYPDRGRMAFKVAREVRGAMSDSETRLALLMTAMRVAGAERAFCLGQEAELAKKPQAAIEHYRRVLGFQPNHEEAQAAIKRLKAN